MLKRQEEVYLPAFQEVRNTYSVEQYIHLEKNTSLYFQRLLKENFALPFQQVGLDDFIDILFPNAEGHFCFFRKGKSVFSNTFFTKEEMVEKLWYMLTKSFGMNSYVSYSTYYSKKKKFEKVQSPVTYKTKSGSKITSKACNIATRREFVVTEEKRVALPMRTQSNVVKTYLLAQDLDFYKEDVTTEEAIQIIAEMVYNGDIICPTMIVFTGQGIQLIWRVKPFKNIKGYTHDKEWRAIQNDMIDMFEKKGLNPDAVVKNPSAVTRLPETMNMKSKSLVQAYYMNDEALELSDFLFVHRIVPQPDRKVNPNKMGSPKKEPGTETENNEKKQKNVSRLVSTWNEFTLNRQREEDIFTYVRMWNERDNSKFYIGRRNWLCLVLRFHALVSSDGDTEYALKRVLELISIMDLTETNEKELLDRSEIAEEYYTKWKNGTWNKEQYVQGGLFYRNLTMLELMKIKDDYEMQMAMKTIKARTHKYKDFEKMKQAMTEEEVNFAETAIEESKKYDAARKRVEKFGVEQADNHTWEKEVERRKAPKEAKLEQLRKIQEENPKLKNKTKIAKELGVNRQYLYDLIKEL
ncbi:MULTISPECIES: hypothetical protein [Bacillus]|uniref:hypothetical protein n=1 Tax=Bacillus TaxID=1386 RepID=UPI001BB39B67|nr:MULTISPECIES: hypothetical protein [Bacillus]BCC09575.1 hypothetical protein BCM0060_p314 [Bacillus cereus]BCC50630.1 hypothetical protein BCJMU02_p327 [Bacillus cereus]